ncbi:MAG: DOMON domain-containing protein [Armatimonadota bacterium]
MSFIRIIRLLLPTLCLLTVTLAYAADTIFDAEALLGKCQAAKGKLHLISPDRQAMLHVDGKPAGKVLLFDPVVTGQTLTITLPVPVAGYYHIVGSHVYGAWKQGRYGQFNMIAGGTQMPQRFNGWYGAAGPPDHWPKARTLLTNNNWGVIYLPGPTVQLVFTSTTDGLLGIERITLAPVAADKLSPADRERKAQETPPVDAPPTPSSAKLTCTARDLGPLEWVVPVSQRKIVVDGDLKEWDFSKTAVTANSKTIKQLGWANPVPQGDADLSAVVQLGWDADNLYLAAHVTDDQLAETKGQKEWGSPWGCDSVVLRVLPPVWLTSSPRAVGAVAEDLYYGLSYYSPDTGPRPLSGGARYVARKTAKGYNIEAMLPFSLFGFRAVAGDRLPFMLIFSDVDPQKATNLRFDQYGLPTRGFGDRQVAQLRLLGTDGWGDDMVLERTTSAGGDTIRFLDYLDVVSKPLALAGVDVIEKKSGEIIARISCVKTLAPGHRYEISGTLPVPATLPAGGYLLRLAVGK